MVTLRTRLFTLKMQSYRSFLHETSIDIGPLTLLYGFNQAGKSTLLRLLALLADSLVPGAGPLDLRSPALRGATFKELGHLGHDPNLSPWLTLVAPGPPPNPTFKIQFTDKNGLSVNRLYVTPEADGDKFKVDLADIVARVGNGVKGTYEGHYRGQEWTDSLNFTSLIPSGLPDEADRIAQAVRAALTPLEQLQWLDANRFAGGEEARPIRCCLPDGSDLPSLLRADPGPAVLAEASGWLAEQHGLGEELSLRSDPSGRQQLVHRSGRREALPLNLAGEGIRSLLPILLCALWAETRAPGAPTMLAVEEPEAHLHPTTQVALFDRLAQTVRLGIPVVLETHSVYLLRAMQLAVLDGSLKPEQIGLYWVEQGPDGTSTITDIEIAPDATLAGWRPDLFEKEQEMAHRILDLRWNPKEAS
jgi:energy-coupling factor transporter ATP-binding protein EcfA2